MFLQAVAQGVVAEGLHRLMYQWDACLNHHEVCYSLHFYGQNNLLTSFVSPAFMLLSHPILLQQTTNFQTANTLQSTYHSLYLFQLDLPFLPFVSSNSVGHIRFFQSDVAWSIRSSYPDDRIDPAFAILTILGEFDFQIDSSRIGLTLGMEKIT